MENGEIDLIDLYGAFKKTTAYSILKNVFNLITDNKIWFTVFVVIGLAAGYYLNTNKAPLFKTEMLVESIEINNYVSRNMITGLNSLISEENYANLNKIGFSNELSSTIQSVETIPSKIKIKNEEQNIFKIVLLSSNTDSLLKIEKALTHYLNNNNYSAKLKKENLIQFNSEKDELIKEVNELDSINTLLKKQLKSDQKLIYTSPASISKEKLEANVRIIELDRMIINSDNYHVLTGFTPTKSPEPIKGRYPLKCALLSFLLGFIILRIFKR